jgi:hypothetical protein
MDHCSQRILIYQHQPSTLFFREVIQQLISWIISIKIRYCVPAKIFHTDVMDHCSQKNI